MKSKRIFRGAVAGFLSISLMFSGMPVMAAEEVGNAVPAQQTGTTDETGNNEGPLTSPEDNAGGNAAEELNNPQDTSGGTDGNTGIDGQDNGGTGADAGNGMQNPDNTDANTGNDGQNNGAAETDVNAGNDTQNTGETDINAGDNTQNIGETGINAGDNTQNNNEADANARDNVDSDVKQNTEKDSNAEEDGKIEKDSKTKEDIRSEEIEGEKGEGESETELPLAHNVVSGSIAIDGDLSDWAGVTARSGSGVDSWKVVLSPDGNILYFNYTGTASTEWDYGFANNSMSFQFAYPDGAAGVDSGISVYALKGSENVKNATWGDVPGAEVAVTNEAHGNNPGPYTVEFAVPVNFFHSMDFTLTFGGASISAGDIEQLDGNSAVVDVPAVYTGIAIDGNYSDWKAVAKTDASCPNSAHTECLSQVAAVFDGDWFYIYVKDGKGSNASGAGTHSNGKFAITSDLGYETDIQFSTTPSINGVNGAQVAYVGSEWEVAIPKDQLPKYEESLSFGLYQGEPFITGIVNLQPDSGNNLENLFNGVSYDGQYEDWEDYGHSTIEYATAGSQESQIDAKGALYSSGDKIYGHVVTNMPEHLQEAGGEFTAAVTIAFNQSAESLKNGSVDQKMAFYPRCVTVDASGNVNWNPQLSGLPEGTYEYYIASTDAWHTSTNISNLNDMDLLYGKMMMTIGKDGKDEMEFYLELPMIAKKLGMDETDLKQISAQFGRIGQQWIFTAGTSTGPIAGVAICIASVGVVLLYQKRKKNKFLLATA